MNEIHLTNKKMQQASNQNRMWAKLEELHLRAIKIYIKLLKTSGGGERQQ